MADGALPPGHVIGGYRIERQLGRGGFGITYLASELNVGWHVAIKEYYPRDWASRADNGDVVPRSGSEADFDWGLRRFRTEAKLLWQVQHPNIVRIHSYVDEARTGYIVMEFVEGESLSQRLRRQTTLPEADIRQFVLPIMDGLAAVHDKDFLHLDVAPKNIMLVPDGRGVLLDFGAARPTQRAATGEATVLLTPSYAALEQITETTQSPATDIYCLGAVLYCCVTGRPPWHPTKRVEHDDMPRASDAERCQSYEPSLLGMIDAALAVRSEDRPQSIAEWQRLLSGSDESAARSSPRRARDGHERSDHELAAEGDADAQYRLGLLYAEEGEAVAEGTATQRDNLEAKVWFRMAATQKHPRARYRLYRMYEDGEGGDPDQSAAAKWKIKAWQIDAKVQYRLATSCREEGSDDEAEFWYRGAAYRGNVNARYELGAMYWDQWVEGKVVDAAVEASLEWCVQRVADGPTWAGVFLAGAIDVGITGGKRRFRDAEAEMRWFLKGPYTAEPRESRDAADAVRDADCAKFCLSYKYLRMAARQGHPRARESCDRLGVFMLEQGLEERSWHGAFLTDLALESMTNRDAAVRCRVDDGEVLDRFRLGGRVAYETIRGGASIEDYESAVTERMGCSKEDIRPYLRCWLTAAKELLPDRADALANPKPSAGVNIDSKDVEGLQGNADYQYERGLLAHYENDFEQAESWYMHAADQGHAKAQFDLGMMFFHGEIEGLDLGECVEHAVSYCMDAASSGLECAKALLDRDIQSGLEAYRRGYYYEAELEFRRLAEQGDAEAQYRLAQMYVYSTTGSRVDDVSAFDQARDWLGQAAEHGYARAEYALCALLTRGYADWLDVDPSEGCDGGATATYWYWKAAQRAPSEQYAMGLLSEGDPEHADRFEAEFWYRFAGDQGHTQAQFRLGLLAFCRLYGWTGDGWRRRDVGWKLLRAAASYGQKTARALIRDGKVLGVEGEETLAESPREPSRDPLSCFVSMPPNPPRNATFPGFAAEMLAESGVCANEPRLLARLYDSYRQAAQKAGVPWAKDFNSDVEIDSWLRLNFQPVPRRHVLAVATNAPPSSGDDGPVIFCGTPFLPARGGTV